MTDRTRKDINRLDELFSEQAIIELSVDEYFDLIERSDKLTSVEKELAESAEKFAALNIKYKAAEARVKLLGEHMKATEAEAKRREQKIKDLEAEVLGWSLKKP